MARGTRAGARVTAPRPLTPSELAAVQQRAEAAYLARPVTSPAFWNDPDELTKRLLATIAERDRQIAGAKIEALEYIGGWIRNKRSMPLVVAADAILDDMRVHVEAAIERLRKGEIMESTTPLAALAAPSDGGGKGGG